MAEELLGPAFEIHGGGLDLVFPHHENELAQSRALGHEFARIWMHNGMLRFTGEKMSKSLGQRHHAPRGARPLGPRDAARSSSSPATGRSRSTSRRRRWSRRGAVRDASGTRFASTSAPAATGSASSGARRRLQHAGGARRHARLARPRPARRALEVFGLELARREPEAPAERRRARRERRRGRACTRLRRGRPAAREIDAAGWEVRDVGRRLPARPAAVTREQVYGRRAVREALRGRREVLELWATERALAAETWLRDARAPPPLKPERELTPRRRHARPPGRARVRRAVPLRRRVRARGRRAAAARRASTRSPIRATSARSCAAPRAPARRASSCPRTARRA